MYGHTSTFIISSMIKCNIWNVMPTILSLISCFLVYNHNNYFAHLKDPNIAIMTAIRITMAPKEYCRHISFRRAYFLILFIFNLVVCLVSCAVMLCPSTISANCNSISIFSSTTLSIISFMVFIPCSIFRIVSCASPSFSSVFLSSSSVFLLSSLVKFNSSKRRIFPCRQC